MNILNRPDKQEIIDCIFEEMYMPYYNEIKQVKKNIKEHFDIDFSLHNTLKFWRWHSNMHGSFFISDIEPEEVIKAFEDYIEVKTRRFSRKEIDGIAASIKKFP